IGAVAGGRTAERVALDAAALIAIGRADLVIRGIAPALAEPLLQLLREIPRRLLQLVERFGLRPDRITRLAALQRAGGVAHGPLRPAERVGNIAHAFAEPAHQIAQRMAQTFLLAGLIAQLATLLRGILLIARLAGLPGAV